MPVGQSKIFLVGSSFCMKSAIMWCICDAVLKLYITSYGRQSPAKMMSMCTHATGCFRRLRASLLSHIGDWIGRIMGTIRRLTHPQCFLDGRCNCHVIWFWCRRGNSELQATWPADSNIVQNGHLTSGWLPDFYITYIISIANVQDGNVSPTGKAQS